MLSLIRQHRRFFLGTTLAALALRLLFLIYYPASRMTRAFTPTLPPTGCSTASMAQRRLRQIVPNDTRLPGYPAFLAGMFALFGIGNFRAVLLAQILLDLATCFLIGDLTRHCFRARGTDCSFLTALCPFLANYAAAVLTETLEVFFTALALDCAVAGLSRLMDGGVAWKLWAGAGLAIAACILLRPDGGILLVAVGLYLMFAGWRRWRGNSSLSPVVVAGILVGVFALAPLVPWTIRNLRTLHHFQPLAPRYATEQDELVPLGFNRWAATWMADYASVEEIYWNVPGDKIDPDKLPSRAFDTPSQRDATLAVIADYNQSQEMTPELDRRFGEIAAERIRQHPMRYYVLLPLLRIADMWLRPRTEMLPPDPRWWEFNDEPKESVLAVGFGLLNLAYVGAALVGIARRHAAVRYAGLLVGFLVLRSAFLGTLENPEPRYTLECYPVVILFAAAMVASMSGWGGRDAHPTAAGTAALLS